MISKLKGGYSAFVAIGVCTLVLVGISVSVERVARPFSAKAVSTDARTEHVTIAVEGMYCHACAAGIKAMLKRTPGVISADVSYARKEALVEYNPEKITPERIVEVISNLGYKASVKSKP